MIQPPREVLDYLASLTDDELAEALTAARQTGNDDGLLRTLTKAVNRRHVIRTDPAAPDPAAPAIAPVALNDDAGLRSIIAGAFGTRVGTTNTL